MNAHERGVGHLALALNPGDGELEEHTSDQEIRAYYGQRLFDRYMILLSDPAVWKGTTPCHFKGHKDSRQKGENIHMDVESIVLNTLFLIANSGTTQAAISSGLHHTRW